MNSYTLTKPEKQHWPSISVLIANSIPNTIVSHLGTTFGSLYYRNISQNQFSCTFIALDNSKNVVGVIIGVLNRESAKNLSKKMKVKLLLAANLRLFSLTVLAWVIKGLANKIINKQNPATFPDAELLAIAVLPEFRGTKLAYELVEKMEFLFKKQHLTEPYLILTEKANLRANSFYSKIGAELINTHLHHGREINEWHKFLS